MKGRPHARLTLVVAAVLALAAVGWDIFVAVSPENGDTFSELFLQGSGAWPALPYALGVVAGHLAWPNSYRLGWWALLSAVPAVVLLLWRPTVPSVVMLAVGLLVGHFVWPQKPPPNGDTAQA